MIRTINTRGNREFEYFFPDIYIYIYCVCVCACDTLQIALQGLGFRYSVVNSSILTIVLSHPHRVPRGHTGLQTQKATGAKYCSRHNFSI
eukprot:gene11240-7809_t